jgi:hypothetical protein
MIIIANIPALNIIHNGKGVSPGRCIMRLQNSDNAAFSLLQLEIYSLLVHRGHQVLAHPAD